jgi:signal transduction histidine kinase
MSKVVQPLRKLTGYANRLAAGGVPAGAGGAAGAEILADSRRADEVGQLAQAFCFMADQVSAREQELRQAHDELEGRVRERTAELTVANERLAAEVAERQRAEEVVRQTAQELARSNAELEQFAYVASHDLQEPLRKVQAFGDLLATEAGPALAGSGSLYLQRMQDAARRMQGLINDLLTFSRVTSQARPFVPVDLTQVAREVVSDLEARLRASGGRVEIGDLPPLEGDPMQLRQLLQNLIGNALKFHRPDVPPVVAVRGRTVTNGAGASLPGTPGELLGEITVQDNGIGFDEKYLGRLFRPFQRLHGRGQYEGTGMGLAICRKIVERHGGHLTAQAAPDRGATFTALLPLSHPKGEPRHA